MGVTTSWGKILLDTSIITRVINYKRYGNKENEFVNHLVEFLSNSQYETKSGKKADRAFYVSAITIAEIIDSTHPSGTEKTKLIVQSLNASNVEIVDFDEDVADLYSIEFIDKLGVNYQKGVLTKWGEENSKTNREILTKDLMILGCGIYKEVDVVLCLDKGMYRIGKECGLNMVYVLPEYFNHNSKYVFEFYDSKCDKEILV